MIQNHDVTIPGSIDPGSMDEGGHTPSVDPPITTALLLDPTVPGYRLDSKWARGLPRIPPPTRKLILELPITVSGPGTMWNRFLVS